MFHSPSFEITAKGRLKHHKLGFQTAFYRWLFSAWGASRGRRKGSETFEPPEAGQHEGGSFAGAGLRGSQGRVRQWQGLSAAMTVRKLILRKSILSGDYYNFVKKRKPGCR